MDFSLTEEQQAMVDAARRFAQQRLKPSYRARETAGRIEREIVQEMGALGFLGAELPQGFYRLRLSGSLVDRAGNALDGDANGTAGGSDPSGDASPDTAPCSDRACEPG